MESHLSLHPHFWDRWSKGHMHQLQTRSCSGYHLHHVL
ncbi:hypothetical protein NPIL_187801, partial [Nephila pilipes]